MLGQGLSLRPKPISGAAPPAGLQAFAPLAETTAWSNRVVAVGGATPTNRRIMNVDWFIGVLKACGAWSNILQLGFVGPDLLTTAVSVKSPGTKDMTFTGAPTIVADQSVVGGASKYLNMNVFLDEMTPSSCMIGFYGCTATTTSLVEMGANDGTNGVALITKGNPSNICQGRLGSATTYSLGATGDVDGSGFQALNRTGGTTVDFWKGCVKKTSQADTAGGSWGHTELVALGVNNNGTKTNSTKLQFGWVVGTGMTDTQMDVIANAFQELQDRMFFGEIDTYPAGYLPSSVTKEVIIFGASSGGMAMAYEAKRRGLTVAVVRSPVEGVNAGGMSANGLGQIDLVTSTAISGLMQWLSRKAGASATNIFESLRWKRALYGLFDTRITGGLDIPIYESTGIASVATHLNGSDRVIDSFTTNDGRTFVGTLAFADCTYGGDFAAAAGVTMTYGRTAAGSGTEANSGVTAITSAHGAIVDPCIVPGDPTSGFLPGISGRADVGFPTVGTADARLMRPNYRHTWTTSALRRKPFGTAKPAGYDAMGGDQAFEELARAFANGVYTTLGEIFKVSATGTVSTDVNNNGGQSTDVPGIMDGETYNVTTGSYITKNTADRLAVWDAVDAYNRGLIYWILNSGDARIPSGIITSLSAYGWDQYTYTRPRAGKPFNTPQEMYVRSGRRMVGPFVLTANDAVAVDGTTPRSTNTAAIAAYQIDDHGPRKWAYLSGGTTWSVGNEGQQNISTGGVDKVIPIPMETYLPARTEASNLVVTYAASCTSLAYGYLRMETTFVMAGQFMAYAFAEMKASVVPAVQDVSYTNVRTAALAGTGLLTNTFTETVLNLPQVN